MLAEIVKQDNITRDDTDAVEKKSKNCTDENAVVETTSNGDDDKDDEDDNDGSSTPNAKSGSKPTCNWEGENFYSLGIRPSMCRWSGCPKFAHQYCQDQWERKHSVQPYNVPLS